MATDILSLNRVQYGGLDFDTISDDLRAQLQVKFAASFNDFSVSSLGIVLLDTVAFGLDTLAFYLDRRATDTYLATARTRRSVSLLSRQLGYKMGAAVSASTTLSVAAKQSYAFPIPIPKGFQWQGPTGIVFESAQAVTIPASSTAAVKIPVYQGTTATETFVSDGSANQVFKLTRVPTSNAIIQGTVQVAVNGSPFSESEFISFDATDQFEVNYNDSPPTLRFGDGVAGNIPVKNGSIAVTYVAGLGAAGQALSHTITKEVAPLVVMFTTISLSIDNPDNTVGGSDQEDLDHAKTYAPRVFKSRKVAVTRQDYEALAGSFADPLFGRVAVAQAISARSAASDLELQNLLVDIQNQVYAAKLAIHTANTDAQAQSASILAANSALYSDLNAANKLISKLSTLNTNLTSVLNTSRTIKANAGELLLDQADASAKVVLGTALVSGIAIAGSSTLTASDSAALLGYFTSISAQLSLISALAGSISASADSQTSVTLQNQASLVNDIGISLTPPLQTTPIIPDIQAQITAISSALGTATPPGSGLLGDLATIQSNEEFGYTSVVADSASIATHVDKILSADCKANLVVVPVLARDAAGFYAPPSVGLIQSLQAALDNVKEVTQTVAVTSGAGFLIPAAIKVRISVKIGISQKVTEASAITIIDGILRDRAFGASLYLSDLIDPLGKIPGVVFVNVTISGHRPVGSPTILTSRLDADGNLIIPDSEVITLSQSDLSVSTEVFTGSFA